MLFPGDCANQTDQAKRYLNFRGRLTPKTRCTLTSQKTKIEYEKTLNYANLPVSPCSVLFQYQMLSTSYS